MEDFKNFYNLYLRNFLSKDEETATLYDKYMALSYAVRTHVADQWIATQYVYRNKQVKRVYYLSLDYSFGRSLKRYIVDAGIENDVEKMASNIGATMEEIYSCEYEFDFGNAPKGEIAHCIMETLASQGLAAMGYGLWYNFAGFKQKIEAGQQKEIPYNWRAVDYPWVVKRTEYTEEIGFGGHVVAHDEDLPVHGRWIPDQFVTASPVDYPVVGYKNGVVNTVRFWEGLSTGEFHPEYANHGDYSRACEEKHASTDVTLFLFPDDSVRKVTEVRIKQQYFLAASSLRDIIRRYKNSSDTLRDIGDNIVIHISDSKCAIAVIEFISILIQQEGFTLQESVVIAEKVFIFSSTAMDHSQVEKWPLYMVEKVLPYHALLIKELNQQFLDLLRREKQLPDDAARNLSLIEEGLVKKVRMGNICVLISQFVSGISDYQTQYLRKNLFSEFNTYFNKNFFSGLNGISLRRWLIIPNPDLAEVVSKYIGQRWIGNNRELLTLENKANDPNFHKDLVTLKYRAKEWLATYLLQEFSCRIDPRSMVVMHNRRIHPTSGQTVQVLYILYRYLLLKEGKDFCPRTYIIGGYAAPSDFLSKQIIKLIHLVSHIVNSNQDTSDRLQLVFIPNCNASQDERLLPAVDLVEQPSARNGVAYGLNLMRYVVNGAIPAVGINPPDREIADILGRNSVFLYGSEEETSYDPLKIIEDEDNVLNLVFEFLDKRIPDFEGGKRIYPLLSSLRYNDELATLQYFKDYCAMQDRIDAAFVDSSDWMSRVIRNLGRAGLASLDDLILEFYNNVWGK
ncbi:glycogen/starch/alpha-glucan family phosphorylase [Chitinivibrio alkaliphilus]|uniref:Alpha-1,4 glucan phosphorylase n=1 Tax=Chitinivibrio alkaliphilus ACht1 TaxID=1313304 RepID=U7D5A6_9BACT|nr:glycogen/starch/alpha-glucan family phosphorylase [Chitinivibrio alkaliphilus]ERP31704.1 glycogen phosphorylase [Chitinivibrio alkaliphilus ACht1]